MPGNNIAERMHVRLTVRRDEAQVLTAESVAIHCRDDGLADVLDCVPLLEELRLLHAGVAVGSHLLCSEQHKKVVRAVSSYSWQSLARHESKATHTLMSAPAAKALSLELAIMMHLMVSSLSNTRKAVVTSSISCCDSAFSVLGWFSVNTE
jgi:hypothetical protein